MNRELSLDRSIVSMTLRTISRDGVTVRIEPKAMRVLGILVEEVGSVVPKERLIQLVWGHNHVTDDVLTGSISVLRKALNDSAREQRIIQTIPKTGYRLIGPMRWLDAESAIEIVKPPAPKTAAESYAPRIRAGAAQSKWILIIVAAVVACLLAVQRATLPADAISSAAIRPAAILSSTGAPRSQEVSLAVPRPISERWVLRSDSERGGSRNSRERRAPDVKTYRAYLLGRYYWNKRTPEGLERAIMWFQEAITRDPAYALAWAALADTYNVMPDWGGLPPRDAFPKAKAAASRALQLDDSLAEAHAAMAYVVGNYDWNWQLAEQEFQIALQLDPRYASAHQWYAMQLAGLRHFSEATVEIHKAQDLDPVSPVIATDAAEILYAAGQNIAALDAFQKVIDLDAAFPQAHAGLASVYERLGKYDIAVRELGKAAELSGDRAFGVALADAYARAGYAGAIKARIKQALRSRTDTHYGSAAEIARFYTTLGLPRAALAWLEKARDDRDSCIVFLTSTSDFDAVRKDERFVRLLGVTGQSISR